MICREVRLKGWYAIKLINQTNLLLEILFLSFNITVICIVTLSF